MREHHAKGDGAAAAVAWLGAVFAAAAGLVWAAADLTQLVAGRVLASPDVAARFFAELVRDHADVGTAWQTSSGSALASAPVFWALLVISLTVLVIGGAWVWGRVRRRRQPGAGSSGAKWASAAIERRIAVATDPKARPCRLVAGFGTRSGRLLAADDCVSAVAFGPAGSGKTTGLIVPNALEWPGSLVMTTTKPADLQALWARRAALGPVWLIAPGGIPGRTTSGWSPVAYAVDEDAADRAAEWLVEASGMTADPKARAWVVQARKLIKPLLLAAHHSGGGIDEFVRSIYDGQAAAEHVRATLRAAGLEGAWREYNSTWQIHPEGQGSVLFTAYGLADAYSRPAVRAATARADFHPSMLFGERPATLLIVAAESEVDRLAPLLTALIASVVHEAETRAAAGGGPLEPRLLLALDEAGNVFRFPRLPHLLTTARGNGVQLLLIYHDLAQLEGMLGRSAARTVVSNAKMRILLPGVGDLDTLRYFSEILGRTTVRRVSTTTASAGQRSTSVGDSHEELAPLHVLQQLPVVQAVVQYQNLAPMRVRLRLWYADKALRRIAEPREAGDDAA